MAYDSRTGQVGVLIEFFYGYAGEPAKRFTPGSDFMHAWMTSAYDRKRGRPHAVRSNLTIARSLGIDRYQDWWGKAFCFDAMIGNSDMHPDNWGLLASPIAGGAYNYEMAPLFDNGSSLSYGETDNSLEKIRDVDAYVNRGRHHCAWDAGGMAKGTGHLKLCELFTKTYKPAGIANDFMIRFTNDAVDDVLDWCRNFDCSVEFSEKRANFLRSLLVRRREMLSTLCADNG